MWTRSDHMNSVDLMLQSHFLNSNEAMVDWIMLKVKFQIKAYYYMRSDFNNEIEKCDTREVLAIIHETPP